MIQQQTTTISPVTDIKTGDIRYNIDTSKMPYQFDDMFDKMDETDETDETHV